jgi:hypothetical protein
MKSLAILYLLVFPLAISATSCRDGRRDEAEDIEKIEKGMDPQGTSEKAGERLDEAVRR